MRKMKRLAGLCMTLVMVLSMAAPVTVFAWNNGENGDDLTVENKVEKEDSKKIEVEGLVGGKFDPTDPDPEQPNQPAEGDKAWISVGIPTKILFASSDSNTRDILAPKYTIKNHSARDVEVSVASFAYKGGKEDIPGTAMMLATFDAKDAEVKAGIVNLRNKDNSFLKNATTIAVLKTGREKGADGKYTINDAKKGSVSIQLGGSIGDGFVYPGNDAKENYKVNYELVLNFKAIALQKAALPLNEQVVLDDVAAPAENNEVTVEG